MTLHPTRADRPGPEHWLEVRVGAGFEVTPASEDASFRRYFRVRGAGGARILMDAPPEHEDCGRFVMIAERLRTAGVHAPEVIARDLEFGYLLLEDLGDETYLAAIADEDRIEGLYADAIDAIVRLQGIDCDGSMVPDFDAAALQKELHLFPEWLLERHLGTTPPRWLADIDAALIESALTQPQVFVHRDFHSRNLMVVDRDNPGVLDFQDAVRGPVTYDLMSLLKDAYVEWPEERVTRWIEHYRAAAAHAGIETGDAGEFRRWFDLIGLQRQLKVAGIFARLAHRDGKRRYLADVPRVLGYAVHTCRGHREFSEFGAWLEREVVPRV